MARFVVSLAASTLVEPVTKAQLHFNHNSIRNRRISARNTGLEFKVRRARLLMSSREQSRDIRTNSQRAPPFIMSFAFTSGNFKIKVLQGMYLAQIDFY